ncbi:extracellular glycoprotein lacritin isoform X6 [Mustela putorius furo]|uniref:Extracellular glycoprotein lacritin isoform X6 n=1 Tax=Mustela putorius furo TaxID=9669 RepID=A0A8U0RQP4_MUSPF|nr:extracellular glycoprotein lacritin isoform X6 [Mustela putorius furo]
MRFSALLFLAALAGVLVYAEGASSDPTPEAAAAAEPEGTTSAAKPASPQEPAQEPQSAAPGGAEWKRNLRNWSAKLNLFGV